MSSAKSPSKWEDTSAISFDFDSTIVSITSRPWNIFQSIGLCWNLWRYEHGVFYFLLIINSFCMLIIVALSHYMTLLACMNIINVAKLENFSWTKLYSLPFFFINIYFYLLLIFLIVWPDIVSLVPGCYVFVSIGAFRYSSSRNVVVR